MDERYFQPVLLESEASDLTILREGADIKTITLVKADHIGDFFLAYSAFTAIRKAYPFAHITLICGPWNEALVEESCLFDEIVTVNFFQQQSQPAANGLSESDASKLRNIISDVAIDLRVDPDTRVILDHIQTNIRIGYESDRNSRPLTIGLTRPDTGATGNITVHQSLMILQLATAFIELCKADKEALGFRAPRTSVDLSFAQSKILVAMNTSSGRDIKNWPLGRFIELARWLVKDMDCCLVLVGGKDQVNDAQTVIAACGNDSRLRSFTGDISLLQSLAVLDAADLFIGNDSGLTHYAAQRQIRTVAIFSGIDPLEVWMPRGPATSIIKVPVPCSPCRIGALSQCTNDHACIRLITYSFVRHAVRDALLGCVPKERPAS
jgi:ADP-heptose:LPS heptosyltransferase